MVSHVELVSVRIRGWGRGGATLLVAMTQEPLSLQALIIPDKFQHILRVMNTNIDGKHKVMLGLTAIKVRRCTSVSLLRAALLESLRLPVILRVRCVT